MPAEKLREHRELIARARVVFHRARAERIEVRVDREVQLRQTREVAHGLQLRDFGQRSALLAAEFLGHFRRGGLRILAGGAATGAGMREDQGFLHHFHHLHHFITSASAEA
jgi:hypothetical protein